MLYPIKAWTFFNFAFLLFLSSGQFYALYEHHQNPDTEAQSSSDPIQQLLSVQVILLLQIDDKSTHLGSADLLSKWCLAATSSPYCFGDTVMCPPSLLEVWMQPFPTFGLHFYSDCSRYNSYDKIPFLTLWSLPIYILSDHYFFYCINVLPYHFSGTPVRNLSTGFEGFFFNTVVDIVWVVEMKQ